MGVCNYPDCCVLVAGTNTSFGVEILIVVGKIFYCIMIYA